MARSKMVALVLGAALMASLTTGCDVGRVGGSCRGGFAHDRTDVLTCRNGRWVRLMPITSYVALLARARPRVPTVAGGSPAAATATIDGAGLRPVTVTSFSTAPAGTVVATEPAEGTTVARGSTVTVVESAGVGVSRIAAGRDHTCAVLTDTTVRCWGEDYYGQLGDGRSRTSSTVPVPVVGLVGATEVAVGLRSSACAIVAGGAVRCWGRNDLGQLGDGTTSDSSVPVAVGGISGAVGISLGNGQACAVLAEGTARCWGWNGAGELGTGARSAPYFSASPVAVAGVDGPISSIDAGIDQTCALLVGGALPCWGTNEHGGLGSGSFAGSLTPVPVVGIGDATQVSGSSDVCARSSDGSVRCWGSDGFGNRVVAPVVVGGLRASRIAVGTGHGCAVVIFGAVACWGYNGTGGLGNGTIAGSAAPVVVAGIVGATDVTAGIDDSCAIVARGSVRCWGYNQFGQLGDGTTVDAWRPIVPLAG